MKVCLTLLSLVLLFKVSECQIHGRWSGFKPATKEVQEIADEVKNIVKRRYKSSMKIYKALQYEYQTFVGPFGGVKYIIAIQIGYDYAIGIKVFVPTLSTKVIFQGFLGPFVGHGPLSTFQAPTTTQAATTLPPVVTTTAETEYDAIQNIAEEVKYSVVRKFSEFKVTIEKYEVVAFDFTIDARRNGIAFIIKIEINEEGGTIDIFVFKPLSGEKAELTGEITPFEPLEVYTPYKRII